MGPLLILFLTLSMSRPNTGNVVSRHARSVEDCVAQGQIQSPEDGQCYYHGDEDPCDDGQWLVLTTSNSAVGSCQDKPCQGAEEVYFNGTCQYQFKEGNITHLLKMTPF